MSQLALIPARSPESVLEEAETLGPFVARFALVSGGRDSTVLAHRCRDAYEELAFIDTGTALPGVVEHVRELAAFLLKPLRVLETPRDEYRRMVLGSDKPRSNGEPDLPSGFPGPAMHGTCYTRLKERQLERLTREAKVGHPRSARVLMLTGLRRAESRRRQSRPAVNRKFARVFANPIIEWTGTEVAAYMERHLLPESEVAALLHRSGECNCGAFAAPGEREQLRSLYPTWWAETIAPIEAEAEAIGVRSTWGWGHDEAGVATPPELCAGCLSLFEEEPE